MKNIYTNAMDQKAWELYFYVETIDFEMMIIRYKVQRGGGGGGEKGSGGVWRSGWRKGQEENGTQ